MEYLIDGTVKSFQSSERISRREIECFQKERLEALLQHARQYSVFWRDVTSAIEIKKASSVSEIISKLPILERHHLQENFERLIAQPPYWKKDYLSVAKTSGSTGMPVRVVRFSPVYAPLYRATSIIDAIWHDRKERKRSAILAVGIGDNSPEYLPYESVTRGQVFSRKLDGRSLNSHLDWIAEVRPHFLNCSPFIAAQLADLATQKAYEISIEQIISQSERVTGQQRRLCRKAFNAEIIDRYSCEETGWIALQCPEHQNLHIVIPTMLVEIVDDHGKPLQEGKIGRVLITSLFSFAMPIIRYNIGDLAEWGTCSCGRTWPVIKTLWGRTRERLVMPNGQRVAAPLIGDDVARIDVVREFRITQNQDRSIVIEIVAKRPLYISEREAIIAIFEDNGFYGLSISIDEKSEILWPSHQKRTEFICLA